MFHLSMPPGILAIHIGIVIFVGAVSLAVLIGVRDGARIFAATVSGGVFLLLLYLFIIAPGQVYVAVQDTLRVNAPPYAKMDVPWNEITGAYIADWSTRSELAPVYRINAIATGGYRVGWFTLRDGKRVLIIGKGTRIVYLEMADASLFLAPDDFDGFAKAVAKRLGTIGKPRSIAPSPD